MPSCHHHHCQWYIMYILIFASTLRLRKGGERGDEREGNPSLAYLLNLLGEVRQPVSVWVLAAGMDWSNWWRWRWRLPALVWVSPCHLQPRPRHLHHLTSSNHHHPASLDQDSHFHIDQFNPTQFWSRSVEVFFVPLFYILKCYILTLGGWTILTFLQITERDEMQTLDETWHSVFAVTLHFQQKYKLCSLLLFCCCIASL